MPSLGTRIGRTFVGSAARLALAVLGRLPERLGLQLGSALGRVFGVFGRQRRLVALTNLRIAFPEWSEERRRAVMWASFANLGRSVVEIAQFRRLPADAMRERTRIEGIEHMEAARRASPTGGVVGITGHFGNWELLASSIARWGLPVTLVHRARSNPYVEALITDWRERGGLEVVRRGSAARAVLRALHAGRIVALPLDQNATSREGIFVPFFGRLACTRDGPARIAMRTGAPVVPVFLFHEGPGPRHVIRMAPALELVPAGSDREAAVQENVRRMNEAVEEAIRAAPEQWAWIHRRWKNQPPGEPRPYPSRRRHRQRELAAP